VHAASQHKNLYSNVEYTNNSNRNSTGFHNFNGVNSINIGNNLCVCVFVCAETYINCVGKMQSSSIYRIYTYRMSLSLGNPNNPQ
jgi:hypothetical protein